MDKVFNIFKELQDTTKNKEKESIIAENKDNELFVKAISFLLDKNRPSGISKKKVNKEIKNTLLADMLELEIRIDTLDELIDYISENNTGTDCNIRKVQLFAKDNPDYKEDIYGLITKSTKLGVNSKTLNKIIPGAVPDFKCMLAEKYDNNRDFVKEKDFSVSTKLDGIRMISIKENNTVNCFTRQGKEITGLIEISPELLSLPDGVYDGELLSDLNKYKYDSKERFKDTIKKARKKGEKIGLKYIVFDYINDIDSFKKGFDPTPYHSRLSSLTKIFNGKYNHIELLYPLYIGNDPKRITECLLNEISNKEEGVMINLLDAPYECKRTKNLLKVKQFLDADVLVTNVIEGDGTNKGKLGAIEIEFEHNGNKYRCNVGSGFSEEDRIKYWKNPDLLLDKIVTIQYFEITENDNGSYGMRFPVWLDRIRDDKTEISMY